MRDKKNLLKEYQDLESNVLQFEKFKRKADLPEDKLFWTIEIECTKKEMRSISLEFCDKMPKAA